MTSALSVVADRQPSTDGVGWWLAVAFSAASRDYRWLDAALDAMLDGRWTEFETRAGSQQRTAVRLDSLDDWPAGSDVEEAAASFRYARNLLSAAETERWLASTGISPNQWWRWLAIQLHPQETAAGHPASRADLIVDGVCSGGFRAAAERLSAKVAVSHTAARADVSHAENPNDGARIDAALHLAHGRFPELDVAELRERLEHLARIGRTFACVRDQACTPSRIASQVAAHAVAWQRVDLLRLSCASIDVAHEALRALEDDGLPAATVAAMARIPSARLSVLVDEADPSWRDWASRANTGDTFGPIAPSDGGSVTDVLILFDRRAPSPADVRIAARAAAAIEKEIVDDASRGVVTWPGRW